MFNQGITDALGPEFQEINKEKQFSGTMVGISNDVLSWIENQMVQDLTPSIIEINNQAIEIIESKKMYKTYIAPVLYSALAWQQMSIKRNDTTRFSETKKMPNRKEVSLLDDKKSGRNIIPTSKDALKKDIINGLKNAEVIYKKNPITGKMEPYMKQYQIDSYYNVQMRRDIDVFSHGDANHWNLEIRTIRGNLKYDLHIYVDNQGSIVNTSTYIPK